MFSPSKVSKDVIQLAKKQPWDLPYGRTVDGPLMLHQMLRSFVQCFSLARNTVLGLWKHLIFIFTLNFLCKWRATIQHHHIQRLIDFFSWKLICRESKNINKVLNWWPSEQWLGHCIFYPLPPGGRHPDIRPLHESFYWISKHFEENKTVYPSTSFKLRLKTGYPSTLVKFRLDIRALKQNQDRISENYAEFEIGYPTTSESSAPDIQAPRKIS